MEHRWGERRPTNVLVRFSSLPHTVGRGRVANISSSGAYMETDVELRRLSIVYLTLAEPESEAVSVGLIAASVVRRDSIGVGLEWCERVIPVNGVYAYLWQPTVMHGHGASAVH